MNIYEFFSLDNWPLYLKSTENTIRIQSISGWIWIICDSTPRASRFEAQNICLFITVHSGISWWIWICDSIPRSTRFLLIIVTFNSISHFVISFAFTGSGSTWPWCLPSCSRKPWTIITWYGICVEVSGSLLSYLFILCLWISRWNVWGKLSVDLICLWHINHYTNVKKVSMSRRNVQVL